MWHPELVTWSKWLDGVALKHGVFPLAVDHISGLRVRIT
jgi:hypothetical protein